MSPGRPRPLLLRKHDVELLIDCLEWSAQQDEYGLQQPTGRGFAAIKNRMARTAVSKRALAERLKNWSFDR